MGQILTWTVETDDGTRLHRLADFARLDRAKSAARHALAGRDVTLAVVKDRDGALVYATDGVEVWDREQEGVMP